MNILRRKFIRGNYYLETTEQFVDSQMESWESSSVFHKLKQVLSPIAMKLRLVIIDTITFSILVFLIMNGFLYSCAIILALFYIKSDIMFAKNLIIQPPLSLINFLLNIFTFYGFNLRLLIMKICSLTPSKNKKNKTDYDKESNWEEVFI